MLHKTKLKLISNGNTFGYKLSVYLLPRPKLTYAIYNTW